MTPASAADKAKTAQEKHPDAWIAADEGDSIEGQIVDITFAWSDQRQADYPLLTVKQADGSEKKVHCFSTVLYNEAMRQRPMVGEKIVIVYQGVGEARVRGQNGAKRYSFRIEGRSPEAINSMYDRAAQQGKTGGKRQEQPPEAEAPDVDEDDIPF